MEISQRFSQYWVMPEIKISHKKKYGQEWKTVFSDSYPYFERQLKLFQISYQY